jgi:rubrerythrin
MDMDTVEEFLAHSIRLEQEAALRFGQLADAMDSCGNKECAKLFRQLADYSRMHQADAQARAGFRDIPPMDPADFKWPGIESPEAAAIWGTDPFIGRDVGLEIALEAETGAYEWYKNVLDTTDNPEIRMLAKEFVDEEKGHVAELHRWIALHKSGQKLPAEIVPF